MNKKRERLIAFIIAVVLTFVASSYRNENNNERVRFILATKQTKDNIITVDLAKQSVFKYYIQPNVFSFYGRGKAIGNTENLLVKFSGIDTYASQGSKKTVWTELAANENLKIDGKGRIIVNWEAKVPWLSTRRYNVAGAKCELFQDNKVVSVTKFNIINSNYRQQ